MKKIALYATAALMAASAPAGAVDLSVGSGNNAGIGVSAGGASVNTGVNAGVQADMGGHANSSAATNINSRTDADIRAGTYGSVRSNDRYDRYDRDNNPSDYYRTDTRARTRAASNAVLGTDVRSSVRGNTSSGAFLGTRLQGSAGGSFND